MNDGLHEDDPLRRFAGLAEGYARYRPAHADTAIDFIITRAGLDSQSLVVDVGAGTGISSRLFARRGLNVIGIEPNDEMRVQAESESLPPPLPTPTYQPGRAEQTGLPDGCASLVVAAQAFHWFEPDAALREFHRLLRPGGYGALLWYERDESDPGTADYGAVLRTTPGASGVEESRFRAGEALARSLLFRDAETAVFPHRQRLDREGLRGRAFSVSYAPREAVAAQAFADTLDVVFDRYQQDGFVTLCYHTTVYIARRAEEEGRNRR
jgi:SAM-dependent methyltransferase